MSEFHRWIPWYLVILCNLYAWSLGWKIPVQIKSLIISYTCTLPETNSKSLPLKIGRLLPRPPKKKTSKTVFPTCHPGFQVTPPPQCLKALMIQEWFAPPRMSWYKSRSRHLAALIRFFCFLFNGVVHFFLIPVASYFFLGTQTRMWSCFSPC